MKNTKGHFTFKGRYTLRGINDVWYVYDRKIGSNVERLNAVTFTKAEKELLAYKREHGDVI
jgi:hypothetical protein